MSMAEPEGPQAAREALGGPMDPGELEGRERATERADRAAQAWAEKDPGQGGRYVARTPSGEVVLEALELADSEGLRYLEVWAGGQTEGGDPHYRVVNPPLLVRDPGGDVVVRGERYREDPLAALAEIIGASGGALATRRRRA